MYIRVCVDTATDCESLILYFEKEKNRPKTDSNRVKYRVYLDFKCKNESKNNRKRIKITTFFIKIKLLK